MILKCLRDAEEKIYGKPMLWDATSNMKRRCDVVEVEHEAKFNEEDIREGGSEPPKRPHPIVVKSDVSWRSNILQELLWAADVTHKFSRGQTIYYVFRGTRR